MKKKVGFFVLSVLAIIISTTKPRGNGAGHGVGDGAQPTDTEFVHGDGCVCDTCAFAADSIKNQIRQNKIKAWSKQR